MSMTPSTPGIVEQSANQLSDKLLRDLEDRRSPGAASAGVPCREAGGSGGPLFQVLPYRRAQEHVVQRQPGQGAGHQVDALR